MRKIAADCHQEIALLDGFHAFGNDLQPELVRQHDHRLAERLIVRIEAEVLHEGPVDLQKVDLEAL